MPYPNIPYKSYCWSFGTTSFRTKNFSFKIETQLKLLNDFWNLPENKNKDWAGDNVLQSRYYDFLKSNDFVTGTAPNKSKDAREKTSGLVDIGIITNKRKLTEVGKALLDISSSGDFSSDNLLGIEKDSFIYLKQMLKTSSHIEGDVVRPFIVLLYLLTKLGYLTYEECSYLLPLCINDQSTQIVLKEIPLIRDNQSTVNDVISKMIMAMPNYQEAYNLLLKNKVSRELITTIGMNRKSRTYDSTYYALYTALMKVFISKKTKPIYELYTATKKVKIGKYWRTLLFNTTSPKAIKNSSKNCLHTTEFSAVKNETELKILFFKYMHLFKVKATLADYFDLNQRYIKNTDIILFQDNTVKLDIIPKHFFAKIIDKLYETAYISCDDLDKNISLDSINPIIQFDKNGIIDAVNSELGTKVTTLEEAKEIVEDERYKRLENLINERFTDEKLISLLELFENRSDDEINSLVTDNADIPTIFEYILGIIWYKVSERKGKLLDYMKLSLEADLLPKTHAGGGEADIVYEYEATSEYPEHAILLEATLANASTQRSMEMEPVSRHLGQHLLKNGNLNSYCVFATTYLNINVISDFRNRKTTAWYDTQDHSKFIEGMKIIPLQTSELKEIIKNNVKYKTLYAQLEEAFQSTLPPHEWYEKTIKTESV